GCVDNKLNFLRGCRNIFLKILISRGGEYQRLEEEGALRYEARGFSASCAKPRMMHSAFKRAPASLVWVWSLGVKNSRSTVPDPKLSYRRATISFKSTKVAPVL